MTLSPAAREILETSVIWDNHACMPLRWDDTRFLPQLERCRNAGLTAISLNVGFGDQGPEAHFRMLSALRAWILDRAEHYVLARTATDIRAAKQSGRLAVMFDIEGMNAVADQPELVRSYYDLGVRWMLVAYNRANAAGGGCLEDTGLTDFGRSVIFEMERAGMLVCCSHTGHDTAREIMAAATRPVIFSHSNPAAIWPHPRNIPDDLMLACAATGGVVGINGVGSFLGENDASTFTLLRHLDYAIGLVGPDHVALGLDYCFDPDELGGYVKTMGTTFPAEMGLTPDLAFVEPERIPKIVQGLLDFGHSPSTVTKVMGGNLLRLAEQNWR